MISKRVAVSAAATPFSPPPPTSTQESDKTLIHAEIKQTNGDRSATPASENKEIDNKYELVSLNFYVPTDLVA